MSTTLTFPRQAADIPDAHFVERVLGGDLDAYTELVHRHQDAIYRHARGLGLDHDTSVDVVQDAFVKAFDRLQDCRDRSNYRAWLFRICRNLCFDELRNVRRRLSTPMSDLEFPERIEDARGAPDDLVLTLRAALDRVPMALRDAFLLKHDAGYTYEEIAEMTEASPSAVKMRVHRAREALREFLVEQGLGGSMGSDPIDRLGGSASPRGLDQSSLNPLIQCDNSGSAERLRSVDGTERRANLAKANGAPAKSMRRMS